MAAAKRRWLPIVAGGLVLVAMVAIGVGVVSVMWFRDQVDVARGTDRTTAEAAFATARRQFADPQPILEMGPNRHPVFVPGAERRKNPGRVTSVQILAWDADEHALATITLPMWLLRLKSGPIVFGQYVSGMDDGGVRLDPKDLERYGPGVVLEFEGPRGNRVLLTAQ